MKYYDLDFVLEILKYLARKPVNMRTMENILDVIIQEVKKQSEEQEEELAEKEAEESMARLDKSMVEKHIQAEVDKTPKEARKKKSKNVLVVIKTV